MTSEKLLTEQQIREQYLDPELSRAGWTLPDNLAVEVRLTPGPVLVQGQSSIRGEERRADYVLYAQPNLPIAVVEAKDNQHSVRAGMQQALVYAEMLDAPFVFSSNGDAFFEHDRTGTLAAPAPAVEQPYHEDQGGRSPRGGRRGTQAAREPGEGVAGRAGGAPGARGVPGRIPFPLLMPRSVTWPVGKQSIPLTGEGAGHTQPLRTRSSERRAKTRGWLLGEDRRKATRWARAQSRRHEEPAPCVPGGFAGRSASGVGYFGAPVAIKVLFPENVKKST